MSNQVDDKLLTLMESGWDIAGYSSNVLAAGAMTQSILLRKNNELISVAIVHMGDREVGRTFTPISPLHEKRKGWF